VRSYNPSIIGYIATELANKKSTKSVISIHNMFGKIRTYVRYKKDFFRAIKYWLLFPLELKAYKNAHKIIGVTSACFDSIPKSYMNKTEVIFTMEML